MEFVEAGGYANRAGGATRTGRGCRDEAVEHPPFWMREGDRWRWRGMFESVPLPVDGRCTSHGPKRPRSPRWRGARLPSEAEYRAAFGSPTGERRYPWGNAPDGESGFDSRAWDPEPIGVIRTASALRRRDLAGNGWEWTSDVFAPFPGFTRCRRIRNTRPTSSTAHTSSQGGVASDGSLARASGLPQLVPAAISLRLRHVPLCRR